MGVTPAAKSPVMNRDDPRQAGLALGSPLTQPDDGRPRNTFCRSLSVGRAGESGAELPGLCSGHPTNAG